jgi:DNA polymerase-3 subunit alpha
LQRLFGDRLYIELQRHGMPAERTAEPALIELAYARGIPLVATNEPFFATREITRRMTRCSASPKARSSPTAERRQLRPSIGSRPAPR